MKPLQGCRVIDLGIITAGAATSALLADLGADVIKIESSAYRDPFRLWSSEPAPTQGDDLPPFFRMTNRNKRSVNLNLKEPAGREVLLHLVANSDIVVENFSRGVLERLGLGYEALRQVQPAIILASISSQGETGPDARYVSFGSTLEAVAGMAWMTGYRDGPPTVSGIELNYPDQVVALFASGIIVSAWHDRQRHGQGAHLDLSQRDLTTFLSGDAFAAATPMRAGNAQDDYALQECFLCQDGGWVAVSVDPACTASLATLIGAPPDCDSAALAAGAAVWAASHSTAECVRHLKQAGLIAAPVLDAGQVLAGMGHDWHWAMQTMPDGRMVKGFPFQFDEAPLAISQPAAPLGTHTLEVLHQVAGLSPNAIAALIKSGVAATPEALEPIV